MLSCVQNQIKLMYTTIISCALFFLTYLDKTIAVYYKRASPNDIIQLMTYDVEMDLTLITRVLFRPDVLLGSKLHIDHSELDVNMIMLTVQFRYIIQQLIIHIKVFLCFLPFWHCNH